MKNYPYGKQSISRHDIKEVVRVLKSDFLTQGSEVDNFEKKLAKNTNAKFAVCFNSGTAALHAAYFAAGIGKNDEFITSPMTFAATANAGLYLGARPVFVDILTNGNINPGLIEEKITKKTKIIIPVHYGGLPCEMVAIQKIARKHKLIIIEDACHALGAKYKDTKVGGCAYSDMAAFSFHPVKHITTGEGGAVTTNSKEYYEKMKIFRTHGITKKTFSSKTRNDGDWYYEMQHLGYNYRLTDFQAALGSSQLEKLDKYVKKRREIAIIYQEKFKNNNFFDLISEEKNVKNSFHLFPILLKNVLSRKIIFEKLREKGIGVQVHYIPIYFHPYYQRLGYKKGLCPRAEDFYEREISLPMYFSLSDNEVDHVISIMLKAFNNI